MRKETSKLRMDGERTRARLIEEAGILAAQKGWSAVTARMVCERAGVNAASINYWFGGRDALYTAVLERIAQTIFSPEIEIELVQYENEEEALKHYFTYMLEKVMTEGGWPLRVWIREVTAPSETFKAMIQTVGKTRAGHLKSFFAHYLGVENVEDARVESAFISTMACLLLVSIVDPELKNVMLPGSQRHPKAFTAALKTHVMRSLKAAKMEIAAQKGE